MRTPTTPAERQRKCRALFRAAHDGELRETVANRPTLATATRRKRPWSEHHDRVLLRTMDFEPTFVARVVGRTLFAVLHRRRQLRALRAATTKATTPTP